MTTGLWHRANDDQLRAVLAHELSPQDLNHVAEAQIVGGEPNTGAAILGQIFPASGSDSGGFFATHPGTADRIVALRNMA